MMIERVPEGWFFARLDQVAQIVAGNPAPQGPEYFRNGKFNFVRVHDMGANGNKTFLSKSRDRVNAAAAAKMRLIPRNSVLFTKSGASTLLNQRAILDKDSYIVSHLAAALPFDGIESKWLFYFLCLVDFATLAHATNMPSLPLSRAKSIRVPIAPSSEQSRAIAKIEELFSEHDKGVESLKKAREQLITYRQAILKHAFKGKLTADWRAQNLDKLEDPDILLARIREEREARYKAALHEWERAVAAWERGREKGRRPAKPRRPVQPELCKRQKLGLIPDGWIYLRFGALAWSIRNGISVKPDEVGPLEIFRISAVRPMEFDLNDCRRITDSDGSMESYRLNYGDLVFTRYSGSRAHVGVSAMYRGDGTHVYPDKLIRCEINSNLIDAAYLEAATNCGESRAHLEARIRTTAGQSGVSGNDIKAIPVPICSPAEQAEIVRILNARLEAAKVLAAEIDARIARAEVLRQSILKKAFSGQLVEQDPNDEPASVLLERIKVEKMAQSRSSKPRSKRRRAREAA